jgi:tRNA-splicing ligase RtcB
MKAAKGGGGRGSAGGLACLEAGSRSAADYIGAMNAAANFAFANRQIMAAFVRRSFRHMFGELSLPSVYDVPHNMAKLEEHGGARLWVHRKGATRAFPPSRMAGAFAATGQPVLIPGSMGTASYVLLGTAGAMEQTFGSTCHGAGRVLSRQAAIKRSAGRRIDQELAAQGIIARARGRTGLAEEQPAAYKDIDAVVRCVEEAGLSRKVARLRPIGVVKG